MGQLYVGGMHGDPDAPKKHQPVVDADGTLAAVTAAMVTALEAGTGIESRTATSDGLTTAIIDGSDKAISVVEVTSGNAAHIIVLPAPTPGRMVIAYVGANGYEMRSSAPATVGIGGGTGETAESAIPANSVAVLFCISATNWVGFTITAATLAAVEAAA